LWLLANHKPARLRGRAGGDGGAGRAVRENGGVTDTGPRERAAHDAGRSGRLTSDDVALVLRRAAALEAADAGPGEVDGYDTAAVEEAAREVGLSPTAVRRAMAELRAGVLVPEPDTSVAGTAGRNGRGLRRGRLLANPARRRLAASPSGSRSVAQQRMVATSPAGVLASVDRFMRTQMFELRRRAGDRSLYRPRADMVASLRRRLDFAGAIKLERLHLVDVVVTPVDDQTLVRVEAELTASRANAVAGGAAAGTAVTIGTGFVGALLAEPALVVGALPAGAMVGAGSIRVADSRWRQRRDDLDEVLASLLDRL
jgi:hypothetical protein